MLLYLSLTLVMLTIPSVLSRSNGAPFESCLNLIPRHGPTPPQPSQTNPFKVNATAYVDPEEHTEFVHVEIYSAATKPKPFKGFVMQARLAQNPDMIADGGFMPIQESGGGTNSRVYMCRINEHMMYNNTWTHATPTPRLKVAAIWVPNPTQAQSKIVFLATVVQDKKTYWTNIYSDPVQLGELVNSSTTEAEEEGEGESESEEGDSNEESNEVDSSSESPEDGTGEVELSTEGLKPEVYQNQVDQNGDSSNNVNSIVASGFPVTLTKWPSVVASLLVPFALRRAVLF